MKNIIELYSKLKKQSVSKKGFTTVTCLLSSEIFLLGVSEQNTPMFLIDCEFSEPTTDLNLECISVLFNKKCNLFDNEKQFSKTCSIITLNNENYDFQNYFLEVIYLLLQNFPKVPTSEQIKDEIGKIVKLFSCASSPAVKTVQGLWAELLVISQSSNPEYLIKSWHSSPKSKFDFNDGIDKIEVKSTSNTKRIHSFALEQLLPNENSKLVIASVLAIQTGMGMNIKDLRNMIVSRVENIKLQVSLDSIIFQTLGNDLEKSFDFYYDYQQAVDELSFFYSEKIPKINREQIPSEISNVKFSCDLSNIECISDDELKTTNSTLLRSL